jgi:D-alanine transaminase/branched-chain amino acid aminotransferase
MNGVVTEFPRCNFFIVTQNNTIVTPDKNALKGITRKKIVELGDPRVKEGPVTLEDIRQAKEAFLTSSTKRIQAIVKIDGQLIGNGEPGEITRELLNRLVKVENEFISDALRRRPR